LCTCYSPGEPQGDLWSFRGKRCSFPGMARHRLSNRRINNPEGSTAP